MRSENYEESGYDFDLDFAKYVLLGIHVFHIKGEVG
jgi:hypothetical protein